MSTGLVLKSSHVVDILGNVIGRDQQIMTLERAINFIDMIDSANFLDPKTVFFDPFCKAGELLLACVFMTCYYRSQKLENLLTIEDITKEIYQSNRYFALAPDERHYRLSLRTFLGNYNSHDSKYTSVIKNGNYLSEIDGRLIEDKYTEEFKKMLEYITHVYEPDKVIVIGNPPYQESDSGFGKSAKPIYDRFVLSLIDSKKIDEFLLVIPARWFSGGKGLNEFRNQMICSEKIKTLKYFQNSADIFPSVDINGGVCFLHYDKYYQGQTTFSDEKNSIELDLSALDIIPDDPVAYEIINKIKNQWNGKYVGDVAWSRNPFGLTTNFFQKNKNSNENKINSIPCLSRGREIKYVNRNQVKKNLEMLDYWKVSVPKAAGGSKGKRRSTIPINQIFLVDKGTVTTETYNIIDSFSEKKLALNFIKYLQTNFARYLIGLRKITQDVTKERWNWVPYVDISKEWDDEMLFKYFNLSTIQRDHINEKVMEWS